MFGSIPIYGSSSYCIGIQPGGYGLCMSVRVILCRPRPALRLTSVLTFGVFHSAQVLLASKDGYGRPPLSVLIHSVPRDCPVLGSSMFEC